VEVDCRYYDVVFLDPRYGILLLIYYLLCLPSNAGDASLKRELLFRAARAARRAERVDVQL
jgi:hypothetical protein